MKLFQKHKPSIRYIKEALDNLPAGLCFFSKEGLVVLCNRQMHRLAFALVDRDLQTLSELENALKAPVPERAKLLDGAGCVLRFADGRVWRFSRTVITDEDGTDYIQFSAYDLTDLHQICEELEAHNNELKQTNACIRRLALRSAESVREQEILSAKMRVHNKMGSCVLDLRRYFAHGFIAQEKEQLLSSCRKTLEALQDEVGQTDEIDPCDEVIRVAKNLGLEVVINGEMPENQDTAYLLVIALRECITNTIRHASGTRLSVTIRYCEGNITATFTDNGTPPQGAFSEGGGMKSMREQMERVGGSVSVSTRPVFTVNVTLPETMNEESEDIFL